MSHHTLADRMRENVSMTTLLYGSATIICGIISILIATRYVTGALSHEISCRGSIVGVQPRMLPYWIPFIGHLPDLLLWPEKLLNTTRYDEPSLSVTKG